MVVARIVRGLIGLAHVARRRRQIAGDDVPADAAVGEMVERRHAPRERIWVLEARARRDAEAEMLRHQRHRRHQQHRIADRDLGSLADGGLVARAVHVVCAEHVGDEQTVKAAAFQQFCQLSPVGDVLVAPGLILRAAPQPGRLMGDTVHVEGVEANHTGHRAETARESRTRQRLRSAGLFWR